MCRLCNCYSVVVMTQDFSACDDIFLGSLSNVKYFSGCDKKLIPRLAASSVDNKFFVLHIIL